MGDQAEELSLEHAMKMADSVRRHFVDAASSEDENQLSSQEREAFSHTIPPGVLQGIGAFSFVGLALLPGRRLVLGSKSANTHQSFRNFVDIFVSVSHAVISAHAGMLAMTFYGGKANLDEFVKVAALPNESPTSDAVCDDIATNILPQKWRMPSSPLPKDSIDPRIQTMISMQRVIGTCHGRKIGGENDIDRGYRLLDKLWFGGRREKDH